MKIKNISSLKFNSFVDALKMNSPIRLPDDRIYYSFIDCKIIIPHSLSPSLSENGGVIIFPEGFKSGTDYELIHSGIRMFNKNHDLSCYAVSGSVSEILYSPGYYFKGSYYDSDAEKSYSAKSLCIDIAGVSSGLFESFASKLMDESGADDFLVRVSWQAQ